MYLRNHHINSLQYNNIKRNVANLVLNHQSYLITSSNARLNIDMLLIFSRGPVTKVPFSPLYSLRIFIALPPASIHSLILGLWSSKRISFEFQVGAINKCCFLNICYTFRNDNVFSVSFVFLECSFFNNKIFIVTHTFILATFPNGGFTDSSLLLINQRTGIPIASSSGGNIS